MQLAVLAFGLVGFAVVAGSAGVAWLRSGRDPRALDDPSIVTAAPPPAMTAATATLVAGGSTRTAFTTALLDLASRDEIAFIRQGREGSADLVGVELRGGESDDPRVVLNRRRPIGEAERWLLDQLRLALAAFEDRDDPFPPGLPSPATIGAGMRMMATLARSAVATAADDDSPEARAAREGGLTAGETLDAAMIVRAYERKTGRTLPDADRARLMEMTGSIGLYADEDAVARDPDGYARAVEHDRRAKLKKDERAELDAWAARRRARLAAQALAGAPGSGIAGPERPQVIPAEAARRLQAPFLFGTLLQRYANRHGWIVGLSGLRRLRWRAIAGVEGLVAVVLAVIATNLVSDPLLGLALGTGMGAAATWLVAPAMASRTREGTMMKTQLAGYRRTLQATFAQASALDEVVATGSLPWLETPDQAIVWGSALGLRKEIESLLARTPGPPAAGGAADGGAAGGVAGDTTLDRARDEVTDGRGLRHWLPAWYRTEAASEAAAMFAGIEAIGTGSAAGS